MQTYIHTHRQTNNSNANTDTDADTKIQTYTQRNMETDKVRHAYRQRHPENGTQKYTQTD